MKRNIKHLFWALLCLFTIVACSDQNNELYITGPDLPELDHEPSIEELEEGLTTFPSTFKVDKQGKIWYKAKSSDALYGYTGDVYVHIGINDWIYTPTTWGDNTNEKYKATKLADNIWCITLSPTVREWFGAENAPNVQNVCVLFRNAEAVTDEKKTADYKINVTGDKVFIPAITVKESCPETEAGLHFSADGTSATFVLYEKDINGAYKDYACLIGDFNNWELDTKYQMKRDEAQGFWWYKLDDLDPTKEYGFQYYLSSKDGNIRIGDPYCEKVLDGSNDPYISASTYPNLKPYPVGKTIGLISVFQTKPATYTWQITDYKIQNPDNMVIYELLLRDFTTDGTAVATGDLKKAMDKLDYLKDLGVNAIELMPIQEFDGNNSWGYNPCYFFAMDKAYGTKEMYKQFIDACHERGMAVLLDVVYNHATGAHPFAALYWNSKDNKTAANNPWFNVDAPHPYSVFQDFNHESPLVRAFVKRNLKFLLEEYKVDGFRFDLTKGFTQNKSTESTASNKDNSRIAILKDYYSTVHETNPDAVMILEHFCAQDEEVELANAGMKLWHKMCEPYYQSAMGMNDGSSFGDINKNKNLSIAGWVSFMESHDEQRTGYKQVAFGIDAIKNDLGTRMNQLGVNAAFFLTISGPKMIWEFGELGYDYSINTKSDGVTIGTDQEYKTDPKPVKWEYKDAPSRKALYDIYAKLMKLRNANPDLFGKDAFKDWRVGLNDWNAGRYLKLESGAKKLIVVGNFTDSDTSVSADFGSTSTWYELRGGTLEVTSATQSVNVPKHEFRLYTNFQ